MKSELDPVFSHWLQTSWRHPKPIVRYTPNPLQIIKVGESAVIFGVINHPAGLRGRTVMTSTVVAANPDGSFETENTRYRPV